MSMSSDGKQIQCNGESCHAVTTLPIALRPQLTSSARQIPAEGWLFINRSGVSLHFCPCCARKELSGAAAQPVSKR